MAISAKKIFECLNEGVIGQEEATKTVASAVAQHLAFMNDEPYIKNNVLIIGNSGTGKTEIIRQLIKTKEQWGGKDVPITSFDASRITEEGYKGLDAIDIIKQLHAENPSKLLYTTERGIIHLDEIDKVLHRTTVLHALLTMIEGGTVTIEERNSGKLAARIPDPDGGQGKYIEEEIDVINTRKIMFIMSGVFQEARDAITKGEKKIGFTANKNKPKQTDSLDIGHEDLLASKTIPPEFLGRISLITETKFMQPKQWEEVVEIVCRKKIQPVLDRYDLKFDDIIPKTKIKSIAREFYKSKLGMRGCLNDVKEIVSDAIFEKEIVIDSDIRIEEHTTEDAGVAEADDATGYRKAAEQGDAVAQFNLGLSYANGEGVPKDDEQAARWYLKAAEQGNTSAQNNLGFMYEYGLGVPKDLSEAVKWYRKAAEQGNVKGQCNIADMYEYGKGVPKDYEEAVKWYRKAAEQGSARGQFSLGLMHDLGLGVTEDNEEAVEWYSKAAEQGYAIAQCNLGVMYRKGEGVPKDDEQAVRWYNKAAKQGYARAQCYLGFMYEKGQGVSKDEEEAVRWYREAAEQGSAMGQYLLADMYEFGKGVPKDNEEAVRWYQKAAEQGYEKAKQALERLSE